MRVSDMHELKVDRTSPAFGKRRQWVSNAVVLASNVLADMARRDAKLLKLIDNGAIERGELRKHVERTGFAYRQTLRAVIEHEASAFEEAVRFARDQALSEPGLEFDGDTADGGALEADTPDKNASFAGGENLARKPSPLTSPMVTPERPMRLLFRDAPEGQGQGVLHIIGRATQSEARNLASQLIEALARDGKHVGAVVYELTPPAEAG